LRFYLRVMGVVASVELGRGHGRLLQANGMDQE